VIRALLLCVLLLPACAPRGSSGGDDDDSVADDDDATPDAPWVDDADVVAGIEHGPADPCPHPMGSITLHNPTADAVDFSAGQGGNVNGLSVLTFNDEELGPGEPGQPSWLGTLPGGASFTVHVAFDCSDLVSTPTTITGSIDLVGYEVALTIDVVD
jgi:hypothetical protein